MATNTYERYEKLISTLPSTEVSHQTRCLYHGFWFPKFMVAGIMAAQDHFVARPTDLFLCSFPKSGTTWLKALMFCIVSRSNYPDLTDHPLLRASPHSYVRLLEEGYTNQGGPYMDLNELSQSPRLLATHMPYSILPESIKSSIGCRMVYVCREPKDTLISYWKFHMRLSGKHLDMEEYIEAHLRGEGLGPVWDHTLSYWRESRANPHKVLFLRYEEMKKDEEGVLKRLASFMGYPFSADEEENGIVRRISELCAFGSLSRLEVNVSGRRTDGFGNTLDNNVFFREGRVGGWKDYLTPEMAKRVDDVTEARLCGSGLSFDDCGS